MGFGPRFELPHQIDGREAIVIMRPVQAGDSADFTRLLQDFSVQQFVLLQGGMTEQDEDAFFESVRTDANRVLWLVAVRETDGAEVLVGATGLTRHRGNRFSSGVILANRSYWRKGIAKLTHQLRTWYAFCELGVYAINSAYVEENQASGRALRAVGYIETGRDHRAHLTAGRWRDEVSLVCYNPLTVSLLWPEGNIPVEVQRGLELTTAALNFAAKLVEPR